MRRMRVLAVACLSLFGSCVVGCVTNLQGAGQAGFGWKSETTVFVYHDAEAGKKADKSEAKISSTVVDDLMDKGEATEATDAK